MHAQLLSKPADHRLRLRLPVQAHRTSAQLIRILPWCCHEDSFPGPSDHDRKSPKNRGKLRMKVVDEVRRRVQQDTLHRRGHKGDPLYEIRRLLRRRADRLTPGAIARLDTALAAGDP